MTRDDRSRTASWRGPAVSEEVVIMREQKIVIGFAGSPATQAALEWALDEANRTGTPAEVVHADERPVWAPAASMMPSPAPRPASRYLPRHANWPIATVHDAGATAGTS
jgi:nucleotide-binding universal stress UspA family protein